MRTVGLFVGNIDPDCCRELVCLLKMAAVDILPWSFCMQKGNW